MSHSIVKEVQDAEELRIAGLVASDFEALTKILPQDLTHIHSNGSGHDREGLFAHMRENLEYVSIEREDMHYRIYGDTVVADGIMKMRMRWRKTMEFADAVSTVTQVWVRNASGWQQVAFQSAKHPAKQ